MNKMETTMMAAQYDCELWYFSIWRKIYWMVKLGKKGLGTLLEYCKRRGDPNLESHLNKVKQNNSKCLYMKPVDMILPILFG